MLINLLSSDLTDIDEKGTGPQNVLERLARTAPGLELWWDSSPLVYSQWADALVQKTPSKNNPGWPPSYAGFSIPMTQPKPCFAVLQPIPSLAGSHAARS